MSKRDDPWTSGAPGSASDPNPSTYHSPAPFGISDAELLQGIDRGLEAGEFVVFDPDPLASKLEYWMGQMDDAAKGYAKDDAIAEWGVSLDDDADEDRA